MSTTLHDALSIQLTCSAATVKGDIVELTGDMTVAPVAAAGSLKVVGEVQVRHANTGYTQADPLKCTVYTRFNRRRTRKSAAAVAVGSFVWGVGKTVVQYDSGTHSAAAIAGLALTAAGAAGLDVETLEF